MGVFQSIISAGFGFVVFMIVWANMKDYQTNLDFIHHLLAQDTIFPSSKLKDRAINNEKVVFGMYMAVTFMELWIIILCFYGSYALFVSGNPRFAQVGLLLAWILWFPGFRGIGGEYFGMWQSKEYNALPDAFHMSTTALLAFLVVSL